MTEDTHADDLVAPSPLSVEDIKTITANQPYDMPEGERRERGAEALHAQGAISSDQAAQLGVFPEGDNRTDAQMAFDKQVPNRVFGEFNFGAVASQYPELTHQEQTALLHTHKEFAVEMRLPPARAQELFDQMVASEKSFEALKSDAERKSFDRAETNKLTELHGGELNKKLEVARDFLRSTPAGVALLERNAFKTASSIGRLLSWVRILSTVGGLHERLPKRGNI